MWKRREAGANRPLRQGTWPALAKVPLLRPNEDIPNFAVVILAAGQGTRMRSDTHKVLHPIAGKALLMHLLDSVDRVGAEKASSSWARAATRSRRHSMGAR